MKILYVTTIGLTMIFFKSFVRELLNSGQSVDIACNEDDIRVPDCYREWGCRVYQLDCVRSPFGKGNIRAVKTLKKLVKEEKYDIVHCHTPVAGACTRIACRKLRKQGTKVLYTAHGFHFYKGGPVKNWMIYYPIEKICAHMTDALITINHEDYELAKRKMKTPKIYYVNGVGVDVDSYLSFTSDSSFLRKELSVPDDAFLMLSVGELNQNKNHQVIIRALARVNNPNIYYAIAGEGDSKEYLQQLINELKLTRQVRVLGYRRDIRELHGAADIFVHPSIREGLPVSLIEAMASGLPALVASNRGTDECITNYQNGLSYRYDDVEGFAKGIKLLSESPELCSEFSKQNQNKCQRFCTANVNLEMRNIYRESCKRKQP